MEPRAGDFGLVSIKGGVGFLIRIGQWLNGDGFLDYEHAFIYIGNGQIVEAEPGGAVISQLDSYDGRPIMWSTDLIPLTDAQRNVIVEAAVSQVGTPYSFLDYLAIGMYRLGIKHPGVANRVEQSKHLICSQLVAEDFSRVGVALTDYPPYLVTPGRLTKYLLQLKSYKTLASQVQRSGANSVNIQSAGDVNLGRIRGRK
jgi:hypothetical protein